MDIEVLNEIQKQAATSTEGKIRVVAGAGSGKTRALAYRYAYLVNEIGIDPTNILCLTFTNKAAREMKTRIAKLVEPGFINDFICTIHGFCVKFLREEIYRIGYPKTFKILDEDDMHTLAKEVLEENGVNRSESTVRDLNRSLQHWKMDCQYIPQYLLPTSTIPEESKCNHCLCLALKQKKYFSLDFNDLINFTLFILDRYEDARTKWQKQFQYIMVDEVQDCNLKDWQIFTTLSDLYQNLFIVGDPDQAIYEWRGSSPQSFVNYHADKDIIMAENYRSTSCILNAANSIILNNKMRVPKDLFTRKETGNIITHFHASNEREESDWVAKTIKNLIESGKNPSDIAILYRASFLSRNIEQSLMREGISYVIWGGIRFFEREEVKHGLSYLRLIAYGDDDMSFKRICNVPPRGIGKVTFGKIESLANQLGCSLYDALKIGLADGIFKSAEMNGFVSLIESCKSKVGTLSISELLDNLLKDSGIIKMYREDGDEDRLENITELIHSIKIYEDDNREDEITLESYLQDISLYTNADYKEDRNKAKLMTIHQSKGLEFPFVFLIGLNEGVFPSQRTIRERKRKGLEEERRLMYVAVTRAETGLFLTESEGYCPQVQAEKAPSRFIREIKQNLFVTDGKMDACLWESTDAFIKTSEYLMDATILPGQNVNYIEGMTVVHNHFGEGKVVATDDDYITVEFPIYGERRLKKQVLRPKEENDNDVEN